MNPLDPSIVNLAKAIGTVESGGNYDARGKSGEFGAYQFRPNTWKEWAGKHLGDTNAPLTKENQDKVAYKQIEEWGKQGYKPAQIASLWNSGKPEWQGNVGKNQYGVEFDTPKYVQSVGKSYDEINRGSVPTKVTPTPSTVVSPQPEQKEESLGQQLSGRIQDVSGAVSKTLSGEINPFSGALQTAGAVAGGIGDITGKLLEFIPGVKWLEDKIGQGVGELAKTDTGRQVLSSLQEFAQKHPELSADIGAGFNIATAIPILRGLGAVKEVALSGASKVLKEVAEKGITKDLTEALTRTKTLSKVFERNGGQNTIKEAIGRRIIPDIENGRFSSKEALSQTADEIERIESTELTPILNQVSAKQAFGQDLSTLEKKALEMAKNDPTLREAGVVPRAIEQIKKRFDGWRFSYGNTIDLATENRLKIGSGKFTEWGTPEGSADKSIYHALQRDIEEVAKKNGLGDVAEINGRMASLIKYQDMLSALEGTPVKSGGPLRGLVGRAITTGTGAAAGGMLGGGVPGQVLGGYLGEKAAGLTGKKAVGGLFRAAILKRSEPGTLAKSVGRGVHRIPRGIVATEAQNLNNQ